MGLTTSRGGEINPEHRAAWLTSGCSAVFTPARVGGATRLEDEVDDEEDDGEAYE
jgi:hypothetical protein